MAGYHAAASRLSMADCCPSFRLSPDHLNVDELPLPVTLSMQQHVTYIGGSTMFSFIDPDAMALPDDNQRWGVPPSRNSQETAPLDAMAALLGEASTQMLTHWSL
jgi:hypothetical protein